MEFNPTGIASRTRARSRSPQVRQAQAKAARTETKKRRLGHLLTAYLTLYNAASAAAWTYFLVEFIRLWSVKGTIPFHQTISLLCWVQSAAVLEILHALLKIVPSPVVSTAVQICSRLLVVWFAGYHMRAGNNVGYVLISLAWSLSDLTRYVYYIAHLLGRAPAWLTWARYTFFLILYPLGTLGEMLMLWHARQMLIGANSKTMAWTLFFLLLAYPFGFVFMYGYMLRQRQKYLCK